MNSPKYGDRNAIVKRNRPIWQSKDSQEQIDGDDSDMSSVSFFIIFPNLALELSYKSWMEGLVHSELFHVTYYISDDDRPYFGVANKLLI